MWYRCVVGAIALELLAFPTSSAVAQQGAPVEQNARLTILGKTSNAPIGCSADVVASRFNQLLRAVSDGTLQIVEDYFGGRHGPPIFWYTISDLRVNPPEYFGAQSKDSLKTYFDHNSPRTEVFRVTRFKSLGWELSDIGGMITNSFNVEFEARDRTSQTVTGHGFAKGGYYCESRSFEGMSVGIKDRYMPMLGNSESQY